ncbi:hypothetical protein PF006_g32022 [Phytophthora fragariae]|uniref:Uncharacterized protein n=1 Tax=Phytophthora fragariae TaxID=53985 RepID=A0A6A3PQH1_9STRA|nr:hypothetical protein PF006_g32022 [Phytophthora fragariae]
MLTISPCCCRCACRQCRRAALAVPAAAMLAVLLLPMPAAAMLVVLLSLSPLLLRSP